MEPLVSCLCITRGYESHVEMAVRCFSSQTYPNKELIVVHQGMPEESFAIFNSVGAKIFQVDEGIPLGAMRNISVDKSSGEYVANWEDDDWSAPTRIELQMKRLVEKRVDACLLRSYVLWHEPEGKFYASFGRSEGWESSLLVKRMVFSKMRYPPTPRGEDRQLMARMATHFKVHVMELPDAYAYRYHGRNTCDVGHFQRMFGNSKLLPFEENQEWLRRVNG